MKSFVPYSNHVEMLAIRDHVVREFGCVAGCSTCGSGSPTNRPLGCWLPSPPDGARFQVLEALQTCHEKGGRGLGPDNCLMPGHYEITKHWVSYSSHVMYLRNLNEESSSRRIEFFWGYYCQNCLDWRWVQRLRT